MVREWSPIVRRSWLYAVTALVALPVALPAAAADVSVGGSAERILEDAHRNLVGAEAGSRGLSFGGVGIAVSNGGATAMTRFTPRFGPLERERNANVDVGSALKTRDQGAPDSRSLRIAPQHNADIAGFGVGWSATASLHPADPGRGADPSALAVGGQLDLSGLQLDASYGRFGDALVGPDGPGLSAGVGYTFGSLATRMGYSLVERDTPDETSLFTVGSQLSLQPGLVVSGDVAYAEDEEGESSTAGVVSFSFSF